MSKRNLGDNIEASEVLLIDVSALEKLADIVQPLLHWYAQNARVLPWREHATPYGVWVSEIMLQQTRVAAVLGYYERFMRALPTVEALANASEEKLLKLWEGLGYYSRARNLQKAAQILVRQYGGKLPASYTQLRSLPGIGDYTAGAIASIAFGVPQAAVDGNVLRVLARVLGSYANVSQPEVKLKYQHEINKIIPEKRAGDFTQSIMELGALICLPKQRPKCSDCPLKNICVAHGGGFAADLPVKSPKKERITQKRTVLLVQANGKFLLFLRPKGLLAGMYEPLNLEEVLSCKQVEDKILAMGGTCGSMIALGSHTHVFTHMRWQMQGFLLRSNAFAVKDGIWASADEIKTRYAIPGAFRRFFDAAQAENT